MATAYSIPRRSTWFRHTPKVALILWACLWYNLDTGFWNFDSLNSGSDWILAIRAGLPFVVLPVAAFHLFHRRQLNVPKYGPSGLLMAYGAVAAFATIFSPKPGWSLYWSITFIATIATAWMFVEKADPLDSTRQLLQVTWIATFLIAAAIGYQARGSVFGGGASGYFQVDAELDKLSRSSGVARWAAVPGLICLIRVYYTRKRGLIAFYLSAAAASFFIVYRMQSRGAVFGSVAALLFVFLISSRLRRYALPFAAVAVVVILILDSPGNAANQVTTYLARGQSRQEFLSMSGRTRAYEHGIEAFQDAAIFGRGQWADRLVIGEHVHNSFLQALLNAGVLGALPYLASWIAGWVLFFKLHNQSNNLRFDDRLLVLECGAVMMFFTVRAIPETTTASYAPDLLIMVAAYVYLESLSFALHKKHLGRWVYVLAQPSVIHQTASREAKE